jgi:hypothetical protein
MAVDLELKQAEGLPPRPIKALHRWYPKELRCSKADQMKALIRDSSDTTKLESPPATDQASLNNEAFRAGTAIPADDTYLAIGKTDLDPSEFPDDFESSSAGDSKTSFATSSQSTSNDFATSSIVLTPSSSPIHQSQLEAESETPDEPPSKRARKPNSVAGKESYPYSNCDMSVFIQSFREILNASKVVDITVTGKGDGPPKESDCAITSPPPPYCKDSMAQRDWMAFYPAVRSIFAYYPAILVDIGKYVKDEL